MVDVKLSNSVYDKLKGLTQVGLPALASLYFGLSTIWGLPSGEEVVGSIAILTTFFGVILGKSSSTYNKTTTGGSILIQKTETGKRFSLELEGDPSDLAHQQKVIFNVVDEETAFWEANQNKPFDDIAD